jgi:hypothetical protein
MLKQLYKDDTILTPFATTKDWNLSNVANTDLVLAENGNSVAVENIDYGILTASLVSKCSVALENQTFDLIRYREGQKITGLFYPDQDPRNFDTTYKRLVYGQIKNMFYNNYRDPTKMWGLEKIDFDKSFTKKFLADYIRVFDIPTDVFGQKIVEGTITLTDNTLDNDYSIQDDTFGNLLAGTNLFSKQQEIGKSTNFFITGSDSTCDAYFNFNPPNAPSLTGSLFTTGSTSLTWQIGSIVPVSNGFLLQRSLNNTSSFITLLVTGSFSYLDTPLSASSIYYYVVYAFNDFGTSSASNIISVQTAGTDALVDSSGSNYVLGPYDTFEAYSIGTAPTNAGFGWSGNWQTMSIQAGDFVPVIAMDDFLSYTSGSNIATGSGGMGWSANWSGSLTLS